MSQMSPLYSQREKISTFEEKYYDVDSLLVFRVDSIDGDLSITYYRESVEEEASLHLQFKGGYESFLAYCDSSYYHRADYNYDELNALAMFSILFDKNLKIKDVRILKRIAYVNVKYNYDALVKRILLSTEGKWIKTGDDDCEWYFCLGHFKLR